MNLEQQVCSLELAKKLKELGVKQESLFYHCRWNGPHEDWCIQIGTPSGKYSGDYKIENWKNGIGYSAFTVAELGEMLLPHAFLETYSDAIEGIKLVASKADKYREYGSTEADARAKMLIYLIENKLITV